MMIRTIMQDLVFLDEYDIFTYTRHAIGTHVSLITSTQSLHSIPAGLPIDTDPTQRAAFSSLL